MNRNDHTTSMAFTALSFLLRLASAATIVLCGGVVLQAGGPKCVAGRTYFDSGTTGQPLTWPPGLITYFTDQGDLSPVLPNTSANSFVADAFNQWQSVSTAALNVNSGGTFGRRRQRRKRYRQFRWNDFDACRHPADCHHDSDCRCLRCRWRGYRRPARQQVQAIPPSASPTP